MLNPYEIEKIINPHPFSTAGIVTLVLLLGGVIYSVQYARKHGWKAATPAESWLWARGLRKSLDRELVKILEESAK